MTDHNANTTKAIENFLEGLSKMAKQLHDALKPIRDFKLNEEFSRKLAEFNENLAKLPGQVLEIQKGLAELGWFVPPEMPFDEYLSLEEPLKNGDVDKVDELLAAWTLGLLDEIEKELCTSYPDRAHILAEGFDNHRSGRYASSITVLLTQADGICLDCFGKIFFSIDRNTHVPKIADVVDDMGVDLMTEVTLHPLLVKSGINSDEQQRANGEFPHSPNRHIILHGRDLSYPSEINSLKVISFVGFLGHVGKQVAS